MSVDDKRAAEMQKYDSLVTQRHNRVLLDTLLEKLTRQQNVKVIAELNINIL